MRRRFLRWAGIARLRPRTVRLRLTALYSLLFLLCGAALLATTYVLVQHSGGNVLTFSTRNGFGAISKKPAPKGAPKIEQALNTPGGPQQLSPGQKLGQIDELRQLAERQHAAMLHALLLDSGIALAITAVLAAVAGWIVAGRALRPLRMITATAREISATNLHRRLALGGPRDELTELGDTFDALLARLETAFQAQRQFVANASHELRTPLARQRAIGQVALADPEATVASLRAAHERVLAAGTQQERLIAALLALARGQAGLQLREELDLADVAGRVLATCVDEAELRGLVIDAALESAPTSGNPRLVETLVANLVENGLRHNIPDGRLEIRTAHHGPRAVLSIENTGPVVPNDDVTELLQPFRRANADRIASAEGLGLGLSIVAAIGEAHRASLDVRSRAGGGLAVTVAFPAVTSANRNANAYHRPGPVRR